MLKKLATSNISNATKKRYETLMLHDQYSFAKPTQPSLFMTGIPTRTRVMLSVGSLLPGERS